jgi:hypothetical protein
VHGGTAGRVRDRHEAAPYVELDQLARTVWQAHGAGALDDDQAQTLAEAVVRREGRAGT